MATKPVSVIFTSADGVMLRAYSIRTSGYTYLLVAPALDLHEAVPALEFLAQEHEVVRLQSSNADKAEIRLAKKYQPSIDISDVEQLRCDGLVLTASALDLLKIMQSKPPKKRKAVKRKAAKKKRVMSQDTKDKISASQRARRQESLLRAVEGGSPVAPPPAVA